MKIIPEINEVIVSDLTPVGVANVLRSATAESALERIDTRNAPTFYGSIGEDSFELHLMPTRRNTLKPRLCGKIEAIDGGSRVSVALLPSSGFYLFFGLSLLFALLFLSNLAYLVFARSLDDLGSTLATLCASALFFAPPQIVFRIYAKRSITSLRSLIGRAN